LDLALMFLGRLTALEGAEVPPLAGLGVGFTGIEAIFAALQLADRRAS